VKKPGQRTDTVWQSETLAHTFVEGVRGGIPLAAEQIDVMLRLLAARGTAAGRSDVHRFADLGCGDGVLARAILARWPQANGVLVDFSAPMIEQARKQLQTYPSRPHFVVADLASAAWQTEVAAHGPFDAVVSGFAIHHLTDERKRELYTEVFALLAPNGMFVNVEHVASHGPRGEALFDDLMIDSLHAFHRGRGSDKSRDEVAREYVHRPDKAANILAPVETQCEWLRTCGFQDVDCYFKLFELAVFGGRKAG
jgi:trans-aconitate methyltransferase